ncbi:MAG: YtxH domain-containing protein [Acetivibrionales bacterium]|jgi:hypothetical protein
MQSSFTKGLIVGSIMGAAISMMVEPDMMRGRTRKRVIRGGKNFMRKSGHLIGDVIEMFR